MILTVLSTIVVLFSGLVIRSEATGLFQISISASYQTNVTQSGQFCRQEKSKTSQIICPIRVTICLLEHQPVLLKPTRCTFGSISKLLEVKQMPTNFYKESIQYKEVLLVLPFNFTWTKTFTLVMTISQQINQTTWITLDHFAVSSHLLPGSPWKQWNYHGSKLLLSYRMQVVCEDNYFSVTCTKFCRQRNDMFGHYWCDRAGGKVCDKGWMGTACDKPICKKGCSKQHGSCRSRDECRCSFGWQGALCTSCTPHPDCVNGACVGAPWSCVCHKHWGGLHCDLDLNSCRVSPCQNGGLCSNPRPNVYSCHCPKRFTGRNCETDILLEEKHSPVPEETVVDSEELSDCAVDELQRRRNGETWYRACEKCRCVNATISCVQTRCTFGNCLSDPSSSTPAAIICPTNQQCIKAQDSNCITPPCHLSGYCALEKVASIEDSGCGDCVTGVLKIDRTKLPVGVTVSMVCRALESLEAVAILPFNLTIFLTCDLSATPSPDNITSLLVSLKISTNSKADRALSIVVAEKMFGAVARMRNKTIFSAVVDIDVNYRNSIISSQPYKMRLVLIVSSAISVVLFMIIIGGVLFCLYFRSSAADSEVIAQNLYNKKLLNVKRFSNPLFVGNNTHDSNTSTEDINSLRTEESFVNLTLSNSNSRSLKNENCTVNIQPHFADDYDLSLNDEGEDDSLGCNEEFKLNDKYKELEYESGPKVPENEDKFLLT